jgi:phosphate uptake regulator
MGVLLVNDLPRIEESIRQLARAADSALQRALAVVGGSIDFDVEAWLCERRALADHERRIEGMCAASIASLRASGESLRFLTAAIKVASDFHRVGRAACDLAQEFAGAGRGDAPGALDLTRLGDRVSAMLLDCSNALWHLDSRRAAVIARERAVVVQMVGDIASVVMTAVRHRSPHATQAMRVLSVARSLQRTTDVLRKTASSLSELGGHTRARPARSANAPVEDCA